MIPGATWRGPLPGSNYSTAPLGRARTLVVHHMGGTLAGTDATFRTPGVQRSAHLGTGRDGTLWQWVDESETAYAQCAGNWGIGAVSVENDDGGADLTLTPAQIDQLAHVALVLGIPGVPASSPTSGGIAYHKQFGGDCSVAWGLTDCPGAMVAQIGAICAAINGNPSWSGDDMPLFSINDNGNTRWLRDAGGILVDVPLGLAVKMGPYGSGKMTTVDLGTGTDALAWNAATIAAKKAAGAS